MITTNTKIFRLPSRVASILQQEEFYVSVINDAPSRDIKKLSQVKLENFISNQYPKIVVFLQHFFIETRNKKDTTWSDRIKNPVQVKDVEVSSTNTAKLFHRNYYKAILRNLIKFNVLEACYGYSDDQGLFTHNYLSTEKAKEIAIANGENPKNACGFCKHYRIANTAKSRECVDVEVEFKPSQLKTLRNYFSGTEADDQGTLDLMKRLSDQIVLDQDAKPSESKREGVYKRLKEGDTKVYRKSFLNRRMITDHALMARDDLHLLRTNTGERLSSFDISNAIPTFTVNQLKSSMGSIDWQYIPLFIASQRGKIYELLMDIIGDQYTRNEMKEAFMYFIYGINKNERQWGIVKDIHDAIEACYPKWLSIIKHLNSEDSFKYTFGIKRSRTVKEHTNIYYIYSLWETQYIQRCVECIAKELGEIPLGTRYDSIIFPESMKDQIYTIMRRESKLMHEIPIHLKEERISCSHAQDVR